MTQLAILGGTPVTRKTFARYNSLGQEEAEAVQRVMQSGVLSGFEGSNTDKFLGGKEVRAFEDMWKEKFQTRHAVSMNSATSCLYAAIGAVGVGPGDEVIVSPLTMSASATAILAFNAIPVFADIEPDTFNIDPSAIEKKITEHTKALMIPNIFGHPADLDGILALAKKHRLKVIEDNAQSPLAEYHGKLAGSLGDIGVFSLNVHKHINTGEGGMCVTDDDDLAERLQLIRNHGEAVVEGKGVGNLVNIIGFNFRLGELEAAIGQEQLKKLDHLVDSRIAICDQLTEKFADIPHLQTPAVQEGCRHVYYVYGLKYSAGISRVHRDGLVEALLAEGIPMTVGRGQPLYLQPMYQKLVGYGEKGCPFKCPWYAGEVDYSQGLCPTVEKLFNEELILFEPCKYDLSNEDIDLFSEAVHKVFRHLGSLAETQKA